MNLLDKTDESYNKYYKLYKASWCHKSGLPMYGKKDWNTVQEQGLYTITRAKKEKVSIDASNVCAWYRMPNGYTPLFRRKEENAHGKKINQ